MKHISEDFLLLYFDEHNEKETSLHYQKLEKQKNYRSLWHEFCSKMNDRQIKNAKFDPYRVEEILQSYQTAALL